MSDPQASEQIFFEEDPTLERRWQALSLNVQACYERLTQASGGNIFREGGVMGAKDHLTIASVDLQAINEQIDQALDWYRSQPALNGAICWYLQPGSPGDLGVRLFARGSAPNWQPHWMWYDLRHLRRNHLPSSALTLRVVANEPAWQVDDLPNYDPQDAAVFAALQRLYPEHVRILIAFQGQQVVGRCMLNVTTGEWGIAGLFAMGVVPSARNRGIGTALAQAACELAQQMGCQHVVLNATSMGEPVYRRVGFQSMGYGHTWYLRAKMLVAPAPAREQVQFLEAVGRGEIAILDTLGKRLEKRLFRKPTRGGLTPLDIAVRFQQPASATWLVAHGAPLDLLSAWDLGWKEQIPILLAEHPELVNLQRGELCATPLQIAIERDDIEFARLLLTVPHDLEIKDTAFQSTALNWAQHFQRMEIIELIKQHQA